MDSANGFFASLRMTVLFAQNDDAFAQNDGEFAKDPPSPLSRGQKKDLILYILCLYILHICSIQQNKMTKITTIIKTKKTVFYYEDLHKIFSSLSKKALDQFLFRAKKK